MVGFSLFVAIGWMSVLVPTLILPIEKFYGQSDAALGLFYATTAIAGAVGSFVCGLATERWGRRLVTPVVSLLLGLGMAGLALAPSWGWFFMAAVIANAGAGALDGDINGLFLDLHANGKTSGALNFLHVFFSAGAVAGAFIIGELVRFGASWQATILLSGLVVVGLAMAAARLPLPSGKRTAKLKIDSSAAEPVTSRERSLLPFVGLAIAICLYVGAELGVTSWVVKYMAQSNLALSASALSVFWAGITLGRLLSSRTADRFHAGSFTIACFIISSLALVGAVLSPNAWLALGLYGVTGIFFGPIFPMLMVIGGRLYPHRLAVLSGSLGAASTVGATVYPGLMGFISAHQGIRFGMLGAALLGLPAALAVIAAIRLSPKPKSAAVEIA